MGVEDFARFELCCKIQQAVGEEYPLSHCRIETTSEGNVILRIPSLDKILQKTLRSCLKGSGDEFISGFSVWACRKSDSFMMPSPEKIAEDLYLAREKYNSFKERVEEQEKEMQNLNIKEIRILEEEMRLT